MDPVPDISLKISRLSLHLTHDRASAIDNSNDVFEIGTAEDIAPATTLECFEFCGHKKGSRD